METAAIERSLLEAMGQFEIIDCHEHLPPERHRVESTVDVFTLFSHYTAIDLKAAGMREEDYRALFDRDIPLDRRWALFAPFWEQIRWLSHARPPLLAAQKFYGCHDINAETYRPLSEAIRANNTPGLYQRVLRDACRIRTALTNVPLAYTQAGLVDLGTPLLTPVVWTPDDLETWPGLARPFFEPEATIHTLDDYLDALGRYLVRAKAQGGVGLKMVSSPYGTPSRQDAIHAFESMRSGALARLPETNPLRDYVIDRAIAFGAEQGLVIAVHTGAWLGDFRKLHPLHMIPVIERHPEARFDIFHLGHPWMREALALGKWFPNVWQNLAWTHILSQRFAVAALDEAIDLVPANKLLAFGGDYELPVEKVYGHLVMAREDIARVLARRIVSHQMTETQALTLARKWFWDNPRQLYQLQL